MWVNNCAKNSLSEFCVLAKLIYICTLLTNTFDAISNPAFSAATFEASWDVQTWGMHVTVVGTNFTLIHIWETVVNMKKVRDNLSNSTFKICLCRQNFKANTEKMLTSLIFNMFIHSNRTWKCVIQVKQGLPWRKSPATVYKNIPWKCYLENDQMLISICIVPCVCCVCTHIHIWTRRVLSLLAVSWRCRA